MMKITLMKDLECPQGYFKAGETVEVTPEVYDWLVNSYREEREAQSEFLKKFNAEVKKLKQLVADKSGGSK